MTRSFEANSFRQRVTMPIDFLAIGPLMTQTLRPPEYYQLIILQPVAFCHSHWRRLPCLAWTEQKSAVGHGTFGTWLPYLVCSAGVLYLGRETRISSMERDDRKDEISLFRSDCRCRCPCLVLSLPDTYMSSTYPLSNKECLGPLTFLYGRAVLYF